jgi:cyclophilin family peptidyl-prolyl cis-trans isomerase
VPGRDDAGYATFGRVLKGMRVLEAMQALPTGGSTDMERLQGQILTEPVRINRIVRINQLVAVSEEGR